MLRSVLVAAFGFVAGTIATYLAVMIGVTTVWSLAGVHDQDGGGTMALGLVIAPMIAVTGGIASAALVLVWDARRRRNAPIQTDGERSRDTRILFIIGGAIAGGLIGRQIILFGFGFLNAGFTDSYWKVVVITWLPTMAFVLGALAGGMRMRRWLGR